LVETKNVKELRQLTPNDIVDHDQVLTGIPSAFLVVRTNGGRYAKLLVQAARQKIGKRSVPILFVERYLTYKEGEERAILASGKNLSLVPDFRVSLDLGQIVPKELQGDLRFVVDGDKITTVPVGKARLFLVTKALADVIPKKGKKFVMGPKFEATYFN